MFIINLIITIVFSLIEAVKNYKNIIDIFVSFLVTIIPFYLILKVPKKEITKSKLIISIFVSIIVTYMISNTLLFDYNKNSITIENKGNNPITIEGIYLNEKLVKTNNKYDMKHDLIWGVSRETEYKKYNKIDKEYKMTLYPLKKYKLNISKVKKIEIDIQRPEADSDILIDGKKISIPSFIYSRNRKANKIYDSSFKYKYTNTIFSKSMAINIIYIILILYVFLILTTRVIDQRKNLLLYLLPVIIELNGIINISSVSKICILIFTILITKEKPIKFKDKKIKILSILISMYISFTFIGDRIINNSFNLSICFIYIITTLYSYLLIPYIIGLFQKNNSKLKIDKIKNRWVDRCLVLLITLGICYFYHKCFDPYVMHVDGYMELTNIKNGELCNWHPYFHIMVLGIFNSIFGDITYFIYFRFIIYALLLNSILFYFNKHGLSLKKVYIFAIILTLYPVTGIMLVTLNKDIDYSLALVALTYYLYLFISGDDKAKKSIINKLFLTVSLIFTALFRHNGIYIFIVTAILALIIALKRKHIFMILLLIFSCVYVYVVEVPLYKTLKVSPGPRNNDVIHLVHALDYAMINNKLDSKSEKFLNEYIDSKKLRLSYDKYNVDLLQHYTDTNIRDAKIDKSKLIKLYLLQFIKSPKEIIVDRLYGTDQLWNISEKDNVRVYKYQTIYDEFDDNYGKAIIDKYLYNDIVNNILLFIATNELLNIFSFRSGIYIDILLILLIYAILKKKKSILSIIPISINIFTLLLVMAHQEYRYLWAIELVTFLIYLILIYDKNSVKECE